MKLIRTGITREVLLIGKYAIKIPTFRYGNYAKPFQMFARGLLANYSESDWSNYDGAAVAPVLWSFFGLINVYPRCEPVYEFDDYISLGLPVGDHKPQNIGLLNGKLVWIDYDSSWNGCPHTAWNYMEDDEDE